MTKASVPDVESGTANGLRRPVCQSHCHVSDELKGADTATDQALRHLIRPEVNALAAQQDGTSRHVRIARLAAAAERAPGTMERLLAVIRLALALCVDVLRSSEDPADAPPLALGFHHLTINELGKRRDTLGHPAQHRATPLMLTVVFHTF